MHAVRGANGRQQGSMLFGIGLPGYDEAEEGLATFTELVRGEPFGHPRQVKMAARYLAVARALKTKNIDGETVPLYSIQEIHDDLIEMGVSGKDVTDILWRIQRGTTLTHQGIELKVTNDETDTTTTLPAAECYVKDAVYFSGQVKVFEQLKKLSPFLAGQQKRFTTESQFPTPEFLARVGRAYESHFMDSETRFGNHRDNYNYLISLGEKVMLGIVNVFATGKAPLEYMLPTSEWSNYLRPSSHPGMIRYESIVR